MIGHLSQVIGHLSLAFVLFDLIFYVPVKNVLVLSGRVFLG